MLCAVTCAQAGFHPPLGKSEKSAQSKRTMNPSTENKTPRRGSAKPGVSRNKKFTNNQQDSVRLSNSLLRLNKALATVGVASRRGADEMIFSGRISVNGAVVNEPGSQVNLSKDTLCLDGRKLNVASATKKYYFALNKPKGYVCANKGDGLGGSGDRLVVDLFEDWLNGWKERHPGAQMRLFTVGRLDVASVGLIFVTNDGDWAQAVQHPSSGLTKEYSVTLNRRPSSKELDLLAGGCEIEGSHVAPIAVAIDDSDLSKIARIRIILAEGKNREVRRLVEAAGMEVKQLRRVRMGGYRLPRNLSFGEFVELKPHEVRRVTNVGADRSI
jgi:pseudouridine synthase